MSKNNTVSLTSIKWVLKELVPVLNDVQKSIVDYAEAPKPGGSLDGVMGNLRQIRGTVEVLELYGASMLAEEMKRVVRGLHEDKLSNRDEALEVLMHAALQLHGYLERIQAGSPDVPMVLMPILNDLRAVRGESLLSESVLFVPELTPIVAGSITRAEEDELNDVVKELRLPFMRALLQWYNDENDLNSLEQMSRMFEKIEQTAHSDSSKKIWPICRALVQSLSDKGLQAGVSVKVLFGQIERSLKLVIERGETAFIQALPEDLLKNLLFYVAQSTSKSPVVAEIRREYRLNELLPQQEQLEHARRTHQGLSIELLQVANQGVRDDVSVIKDLVEIYVHADERKLSMLDPLDGLLRRVIDTLSMLGVGEAHGFLASRQVEIRDLLARQEDPGDDRLFDIATALLRVEDMLDRHVSEQISLLEPDVSAPESATTAFDTPSLRDLPEREYSSLMQALVKESLRTFARTREAFIEYANRTENAQHIENVPGLLVEVIGLFRIVPNDALLPLLLDLTEFMKSRYIRDGVIPDQTEQELVADTITGIEYYLESVGEDEQEREYILELSRSALDPLMALNEAYAAHLDEPVALAADSDSPQVVDLTDVDVVDVVDTTDATDATDAIDATDTVDTTLPSSIELESESDADRQDELKDQATDVVDEKSALRVVGVGVDEEILEIFIEEALDELEVINQHLPVWKSNTDDEVSLVRVRRSFHTLKGSGRLLGAERIGELAWSNENLANYVLRGDIQISETLFSLLDESAAVLPQLIAQLRGDNTEIEFESIIARINLLIDRTINPEAPDVDTPDADTPSADTPEPTLADLDVTVADQEPSEALPASDKVSEELKVDDLDVIDLGAPLDDAFTEELQADPPEEIEVIEFDSLPESSGEVADAQAHVDHGIDPVLLDIFFKESCVHIETLEKIYQQSIDLNGVIDPSEKLVRALHTLRGSAETAQVVPIASLTGPFERIVRHKREVGQVFAADEGVLLKEVADGVSSVLNALLASVAIPATVNHLITRIAAYSDEVFRSVEPLGASEGDNELDSIFIEEADELVDAVEKIVAQWRETPADTQFIADIKRHLHTLKGGARMAGYIPVADLTHALESSIVEREELGKTPPESYFDLLQETVDALAVNIEQARNGQQIGRFDWIVDDLNAGGKTNQLPLAEDAPVSQAVPQFDETPSPATSSPAMPSPAISSPATPSPAISSPATPTTDQVVDFLPESTSNIASFSAPQQPMSEAGTAALAELAPPLPVAPTIAPIAPQPPGSSVVSLKLTANAIEEALKDAKPTLISKEKNPDKAQEQIRVQSGLLDNLVNNAGEVSIYHARFGQQIGDMRFNLNELEQTVDRLREQLRMMDRETEAQILYGYDQETEHSSRDFDPLELDRYSQIQELSRSLLESVSDLDSIKGTLADLTSDSEKLMLQQSRVSTELQEGLLRTRMVRFDGVEARLARIVRQTAQSLHKKATLLIVGGDNEIDRSVQERMIAPLEHILRNAVAHGIELPEEREKAAKPATGKVVIRLSLDGGDIIIRIADDGGGINRSSVRNTAVDRGLIDADATLSDQDMLHLVFESGFSTVTEVTQIVGRGVGLDVVDREIKQLGGSLMLESEEGVGTMFVIRLPQTLAISQALLVGSAGATYALPINGIRGVSRVDVAELSQYYQDSEKRYVYADEAYPVIRLTTLLNVTAPLREPAEQVPLIIVRSGDEMAAVQVDELIGRREIVVKPAGQQVSQVRGVAGATLLGDGQVVLVLDVGGLLQTMGRSGVAREPRQPRSTAATLLAQVPSEPEAQSDNKLSILVVDDSITIRKVTARMLERHNVNVLTAKDGVDALAVLESHKPDLMLLDIEMPRMDGFEVAGFVRGDTRLKDLPIVVITSRTGDKHRERAYDIGVDKYLGKPYQESELMKSISEVLNKEFIAQ